MYENGEMTKIELKWSRSVDVKSCESLETESLDIMTLSTVFMLLITIQILSLILMGFENCAKRIK